MTLVKEGFGFSHSFEKRKWGEVKKGYCHFRDGDIGIAKISPCFENRKSTIFVNLPNGIGAGTTELSILRGTYVCNKFYLFLFQTDWYIKEGIKYFKGVVGQQRVNKDIFTSLHIPLPPINEQKRIADKIEELFNTIDIIESNQNDLESLVKQAKTKILDLAIRGKIVPQDPNDEPASELLKRINPNLSESCDNPHYENLPQTWECLKLKETCQLQDGIKAEGDHIILDAKYLRGKTSGTLCNKGKLVKKGELLILVDGENSGEVFTAPCDGYLGSTFKKLCINNELYAPYILYFITLHKDMLRNSKKGAAIPHLNKEIFYNLIIGIPPFEEQKRIVSKIESLFETLDTIKSLVN